MTDFKTGDRVRYIGHTELPHAPATGTIGVITSSKVGSIRSPLVSYEGYTKGHDGMGTYGTPNNSHWFTEPEYLELVVEAPSDITEKPLVRTFATGANRDLDENKFDYEAFLSPYVMSAYAAYMHGKRKLADGSMRDGDNWQKGIPLDAYMKSAWRHFMDWWGHHRKATGVPLEDLETALLALRFNIDGYLHEIIKKRVEGAA